MKKPKKVKTISQLKKLADKVFSLYIRKRHALNDLAQCVSCDKWLPIKEIQCGHYISRSHNATRYSESNCFPQCVGCNVFKNGNYPAYTTFLIRKFGDQYILDLEAKGREIKQFTTQELEEIISKYKEGR